MRLTLLKYCLALRGFAETTAMNEAFSKYPLCENGLISIAMNA